MPYQPTSTKKWLIQPCTVSDGPAIGRNSASAFWEEPMWRAMWPADKTLEFVIEQLAKRSPMRLLQDPHKMRQQKAVDPDTGELVGYCRWELPLSKQTKLLIQGSTERGEQGSSEGLDQVRSEGGGDLDEEAEWPEAAVPGVSEEDLKKFQEMRKSSWWDFSIGAQKDKLDEVNTMIQERIVQGREFIVLDYLSVHPSNKGKGIASALVQSGIEQAKRMGLPIFIHSWKSARGLYLRLGFEEVERSIQDGSGERYGFGTKDYNVYFMVYEPRSKVREGNYEALAC